MPFLDVGSALCLIECPFGLRQMPGGLEHQKDHWDGDQELGGRHSEPQGIGSKNSGKQMDEDAANNEAPGH